MSRRDQYVELVRGGISETAAAILVLADSIDGHARAVRMISHGELEPMGLELLAQAVAGAPGSQCAAEQIADAIERSKP